MPPMLCAHDLHFAYDGAPILEGLSFCVEAGEISALIGISGSGKTTLFRLITGLIRPSRGEIVIGGRSHPVGGQETTYMQQEDLLLPWRTVLDNLLLFTELGKERRQDQAMLQQAYHLLKRVNLEEYAHAYPHQLSGGMRQRVSLARALLQDRPLLLLDEPFASLDVITREELYALLREIRDQYRKTLVMVTHDFRDAISLADRILVLSKGKIVATHILTDETRKDAHLCEALTQKIRAAIA